MPPPVGYCGLKQLKNVMRKQIPTVTEIITAKKFHPTFWLAVALAVIATSCATTGSNQATTDGSGFPLKGGQLLIQH